MKVKQQIANFFTLLNLASGVIAILLIINRDLYTACLFVFVGAFFDFIDGFVARALGITSEMGKQLDSLSDVVTFGVVPGLIAYKLLGQAYFLSHGYTVYPPLNELPQFDAPSLFWHLNSPLTLATFLIPTLIPAFSALRLAKFNIDTKQSKNFIGLPTPANGLLWASFGIIAANGKNLATFGATNSPLRFAPAEVDSLLMPALGDPSFLIFAIVIMSFLLVSPLSLMGMKFDKFTFRGNEMKFTLILVALVLLVMWGFTAIPIILLLYIIFSIIHFYILKRHEIQS